MKRIIQRIDSMLLDEGAWVSKDQLLEVKVMLTEFGDVGRKKQPYAKLVKKYTNEIADWLDTDVLIVKQKIDNNDFNPGEMKLIVTNVLYLLNL